MRKKATAAESCELLLVVFLPIGNGSCNVSKQRQGNSPLDLSKVQYNNNKEQLEAA